MNLVTAVMVNSALDQASEDKDEPWNAKQKPRLQHLSHLLKTDSGR